MKGKKNFFIVGDDKNTRLKPAVFRRGVGYKTIDRGAVARSSHVVWKVGE